MRYLFEICEKIASDHLGEDETIVECMNNKDSYPSKTISEGKFYKVIGKDKPTGCIVVRNDCGERRRFKATRFRIAQG